MNAFACAVVLLLAAACAPSEPTPTPKPTPAPTPTPTPTPTPLRAAHDPFRVVCEPGKSLHIEATVPTGGHGLVLDTVRTEQGASVVAITLRAPAKDAVVTQAVAELALDLPWAKVNPGQLGRLVVQQRQVRDGEHYFVEPRHEQLCSFELPK